MNKLATSLFALFICFSSQVQSQENLPESPKSSLLIGTNLGMSNKPLALVHLTMKGPLDATNK